MDGGPRPRDGGGVGGGVTRCSRGAEPGGGVIAQAAQPTRSAPALIKRDVSEPTWNRCERSLSAGPRRSSQSVRRKQQPAPRQRRERLCHLSARRPCQSDSNQTAELEWRAGTLNNTVYESGFK
ncbi:hypothetical protein DPEC_G00083620 [Dallia pectoralis]|uniref:Uncharacterized protein n=1 Tax=Dallia pectoralis TaxID=75939 RepID=A0ACC2GYV3_DALPE|nr:hypothetical protein DPEC_G00083620 [Dallia pectoralis]